MSRISDNVSCQVAVLPSRPEEDFAKDSGDIFDKRTSFNASLRDTALGKSNLYEKELVAAAKAGDTKSFDILCERNATRLFGIFSSRNIRPSEHQDLLQESLIKAWKGIHNFNGEASFGTWLFRIAINVTSDYIRKTSKRDKLNTPSTEAEDILDKLIANPKLQPDQVAISEEKTQKIRSAIASLSKEHQEVVNRILIDGESRDDFAQRVGQSRGTVGSQLFYARRYLLGLLGDLV